VRLPTADLGAKAAETLLQLLDRDAAAPPLRTVLPNQLLLRASTAAPRRRGRGLARTT
jgi:DNA-binding LacI/PurR family transcriptional regulator